MFKSLNGRVLFLKRFRSGHCIISSFCHFVQFAREGEAKVMIDADEPEAQLAGLSLNDIAQQMKANLEGATGGSVLEETEVLWVFA